MHCQVFQFQNHLRVCHSMHLGRPQLAPRHDSREVAFSRPASCMSTLTHLASQQCAALTCPGCSHVCTHSPSLPLLHALSLTPIMSLCMARPSLAQPLLYMHSLAWPLLAPLWHAAHARACSPGLSRQCAALACPPTLPTCSIALVPMTSSPIPWPSFAWLLSCMHSLPQPLSCVRTQLPSLVRQCEALACLLAPLPLVSLVVAAIGVFPRLMATLHSQVVTAGARHLLLSFKDHLLPHRNYQELDLTSLPRARL